MESAVYEMSVETFVPMLRSLAALFDKAAAHARERNFDPDLFVESRLAPDMYPLWRQVDLACDHAVKAAALLIAVEPPHDDGPLETLAQLKARIARTIDYLDDIPAGEYEGAEDVDVILPLGGGLVLERKGLQFLRDWALPHFYFHLVTAYDILRHGGVEIGKRDYLSHVGPYIRAAEAGPT